MAGDSVAAAASSRTHRVLIAVYGCLFVVAGLGFSPYGFNRAEVFVTPKVQLWLLSLVPLLLLVLVGIRERHHRADGTPRLMTGRPPAAVIAALVAMVVIAAITALQGQRVSWIGYPSIPEGALFFLALFGGFALVWAVARRHGPIDRVVRASVIIVAVGASLAAVPQVIDWRIDFTVTSGQTVGDPPRHTLVSVWRGQSPNTFFWHRGHLGIVACVGLLTAAGSLLRLPASRRRTRTLLYFALVVTSLGVMVSSTRAPQLAAGIGMVVLWLAELWYARLRSGATSITASGLLAKAVRQAAAVLLGLALGGGLMLGAGDVRALSLFGLVAGEASVDQVFGGTSGRDRYWRLSLDAWRESPWLGTGFMSFHLVQAADALRSAVEGGELTSVEANAAHVSEGTVSVVRDDGSRWWRYLWGSKPHNAVLELLLGVGVIGALVVLAIYGGTLIAFFRSREPLGIALIAAWFTYLLFWYESIQYSPVVWSLMAVLVARAPGARTEEP